MFGIKPNYRKKIFKAVERDDLDEVKICLKNLPLGIKEPEDGENLVRYSVQNRAMKTLSYVLEQGCNPNVKTDTGRVTLALAVELDSLEMVRLLLKYNVEVDAYNSFGKNALHYAAGKSDLDIIKSLVEAGGDITLVTKSGQTVERLAEDCGYKHILEYLKKYKASKLGKLKELPDNRDKILLLKHNKEELEIIESNDNVALRTYWNVTDNQEIARVSDKVSINMYVTEIFNFEAQSLLTIVKNKETRLENILKENFEDVSRILIDTAILEYETKTGEKVVELGKQVQPWNNLNNNSSIKN